MLHRTKLQTILQRLGNAIFHITVRVYQRFRPRTPVPAAQPLLADGAPVNLGSASVDAATRCALPGEAMFKKLCFKTVYKRSTIRRGSEVQLRTNTLG